MELKLSLRGNSVAKACGGKAQNHQPFREEPGIKIVAKDTQQALRLHIIEIKK